MRFGNLAGLAVVSLVCWSLSSFSAPLRVTQPQPISFIDILAAIEATDPIPADQLPANGMFYSAQMANQLGGYDAGPPFPPNMGLPAWCIDSENNVYLLDDLEATSSSGLTRMSAMVDEPPSPVTGTNGGGGVTPFVYIPRTNGLWVEATGLVNGYLTGNLHNATNYVYALLSKTNLSQSGWTTEIELFPGANTTSAPFSIPWLGRENVFLQAMDWTGVTHGGNEVPDWWFWYYFGTTNLSDNNLDGQNRYLSDDFQNGVDPNVISFTVSTTNNYVKADAPVQLSITSGTPYYIAISVDDTNYATDASWMPYSGSNVSISLGNEGWHDVMIGLRGLPATATATWQPKRIKLDLTPPALIITNPVGSSVSIPLVQIIGFCSEALSSITYDLNNAAETITNQQVFVLDQYYDTNSSEFTTNTFQAFDVALTDGPNNFTFNATDLAGNVTTVSYSLTVDYSSKNTPPTVQVAWPQPGTQISGSAFTIDGQLDDATVTIAATITCATNTNTINGLVERSGKFWIETLPLYSGTNTVTLVATDVVGNTNATSFNVVQSALTLTVNPVSDPQELWQPTVSLSGTISDSTYAIWVNGVKGLNNGNGTWSASNVPVNSGGTASFTATGYAPDEQQPDGSYGN